MSIHTVVLYLHSQREAEVYNIRGLATTCTVWHTVALAAQYLHKAFLDVVVVAAVGHVAAEDGRRQSRQLSLLSLLPRAHRQCISSQEGASSLSSPANVRRFFFGWPSCNYVLYGQASNEAYHQLKSNLKA